MTNFKRILSACLAACMVVGMTACNGKDKNNSGGQTGESKPREDGSNPAAISSEVIKPTYFFNSGSYIFSGKEPIFETIKYYTNIEFQPNCVPLSAYDEKVSTVLASADLPDLLCLRSATMAKEYALKGAFVNLTPYIEKGEMKNFMAMIEKHPPAEALTKNSDGDIYGVPRIYDGIYMDQTWQIRMDLLKKHNIPVPTNMDEVYDTLVKLKELYPDSYPYSSRWGISHAVGAPAEVWSSGLTMMIDLDTRDYKFGPAEPGYIKALQFMKDCYQNGLLHPEFATLSDEQFLEQFANGKAFMTFDYQFADDIVESNKGTLEEGWDLDTFVQPADENGKRFGTWVLDGYYGMTRVIASNSEYKDQLVKYLDWLYSEEGIDAMELGIEGKMYTEDAEGNVTFEESYDPRKVENTGLHDVAFATVMSAKGRDAIDIAPGSYAEKAFNTIEAADAFMDEPVIYASWYDKDKQKEYNDIITPINTYIEECTMKVITGEMAIEDWDTVVIPQCEKMGYKRALELVQEALEQTLGE